MDAIQILRSPLTGNHRDRQQTINDLTEREQLSRYKFGRNTINLKNAR
jgi:hypothetical protein